MPPTQAQLLSAIGGPEHIHEIAAAWGDQYDEYQSGFTSASIAQVGHLAHRLKGGASVVAARHLVECATKLHANTQQQNAATQPPDCYRLAVLKHAELVKNTIDELHEVNRVIRQLQLSSLCDNS